MCKHLCLLFSFASHIAANIYYLMLCRYLYGIVPGILLTILTRVTIHSQWSIAKCVPFCYQPVSDDCMVLVWLAPRLYLLQFNSAACQICEPKLCVWSPPSAFFFSKPSRRPNNFWSCGPKWRRIRISGLWETMHFELLVSTNNGM